MTDEKAIEVIKSECYVSNLLDLDKTVMINTALDRAVDALKGRQSGEWMDPTSSMCWCNICGCHMPHPRNYCPDCGSAMTVKWR